MLIIHLRTFIINMIEDINRITLINTKQLFNLSPIKTIINLNFVSALNSN